MIPNGTILLIEDEKLLMDICDVFISKLHYTCLKAKTGQEAVSIAESHKGDIDLALLDLGLPDMEGIDVYRKLIKARPSLKVVICSGYSENGPGREILAVGADAFLQKPFSFSDLSSKINKLMDRRMEKRFKAQQDAVIIPGSGLPVSCRIVDISRHGMAFCYDRNADFSNNPTNLTIHAVKTNFSLENIKCTSVSNIEFTDDADYSKTTQNRHSVMFKHLSYSQMAQIEEFMENHSISDADAV